MKRIIRAAFLVAGVAAPAHAHPIHTTLTKVSINQNTITLNIRAFADDFSATVARFAGRKAPADSSVVSDEVLRYAQSFLSITNASHAPVKIESCGIKRSRELYFVCFKAQIPTGTSGARLRNQMLTELHADQVNIVQMEPPAERKTMLFTKNSQFAQLTR